MSTSIPLSKPKRTVNINEFAKEISVKSGVSLNSVNAVLNAYTEVIRYHLLQAEAVNHRNLVTWHLRRRDFTPYRIAKVKEGINATFPPFCYYPYAKMSTNLRNYIAANKDEIDRIHKSSSLS